MLVALAFLTLPAGFAVAELTGVRAIGGLVLLAGLAACVVLAEREALPRSRTATVIGVALVAFVLSHPLGRAVPPMLAATIAGAVVGATALWVRSPDRRTA